MYPALVVPFVTIEQAPISVISLYMIVERTIKPESSVYFHVSLLLTRYRSCSLLYKTYLIIHATPVGRWIEPGEQFSQWYHGLCALLCAIVGF